MSFDLTDLHTLIVRAHHRHDVPIGKMMRVALQAAANRKFPLYKSDGSRLELKKGAANRNWLLRHAAIAEQQTEVLWWEEKPWSALRAVLLREREFWEWFNGELATGEQNKVGGPSSDIRDTVIQLMKEGTQPAHTVSWDQFCDLVRDRCDAWKDRKNRVSKRGFSNKTIIRVVISLRMDKWDKQDK